MTSADPQDQLLTQLMAKARQGDTKAYEQVLAICSNLVRRMIIRKIADERDLEDIVQNTLLAIHNASHTYNTERSFMGWIYAIAKFKLNDFLKAHYKKNEFIDDSIDEDSFVSDIDSSELPSSAELLNELLQELPPHHRRIVHLLKVDGYSIKEVCSQLNMSESAVKVTAHRAYKALIQKAQKRKVNDD